MWQHILPLRSNVKPGFYGRRGHFWLCTKLGKKILLYDPNVLHRDVQVVRAQSGALGYIREHKPKLQGT